MDSKLKILTPAEKRAEEDKSEAYAELIAEGMNSKELDENNSLKIVLEYTGKGIEKAIDDLKLRELGWDVLVTPSFDGNSKKILHYRIILSESTNT